MKDLPELDAELSALLAEVASDPRSRLRLAPRRALRSWYLSDEVLHPGPVETSVAERHLLQAHRDTLAEILLRAAKIAYWRKPTLSIPLDRSARLYVPAYLEQTWPRVSLAQAPRPLWPLLEDPSKIRFEHGQALAQASLALVPTDAARLTLACLQKELEPRSAAHMLDALTGPLRDPKVREAALLEAGSCLAMVGDTTGSTDRYMRARSWSPLASLCLFNLNVFAGSSEGARPFIKQVDEMREHDRKEACIQILVWARSRPQSERVRARRAFQTLTDELSAGASELSKIHDF